MFYLCYSSNTISLSNVVRLTRLAQLTRYELLNLPEHLSSLPLFCGFCVTQSLVLYSILLEEKFEDINGNQKP